MTRLREAVAAARTALRSAGIDTPELDARVLAAHAAGVTPGEVVLRGDAPLSPEAEARLAEAVRRRLTGVPVARILGRREFWGLDFLLGPETLVPRPETETLVERALHHLQELGPAAPCIADLGTGSGAILLALLSAVPEARGVGIERAPGAASVARTNAARLGLAARAVVAQGDWAGALALGGFDVVASNPPYIAAAELPGLAVEVRDYDPHAALDGGPDGLAAYRALLPGAVAALAPGGLLALEIGETQADDVVGMVRATGLEAVTVTLDLAGWPRVVSAIAPRAEK